MPRITPPDDIDRINERIEREAAVQVQDRDSYDLAFSDILGIDEPDLSGLQMGLRNKGFREYITDHPFVSEERIFSKAKGKDLERDRKETAKEIVTTAKEYKKRGARKVDLKGYDTARQKISKGIAIRRRFTIPAKVKGKAVFSIKTSVIVRGKSHIRFRDSKGRFASASPR